MNTSINVRVDLKDTQVTNKHHRDWAMQALVEYAQRNGQGQAKSPRGTSKLHRGPDKWPWAGRGGARARQVMAINRRDLARQSFVFVLPSVANHPSFCL